MATYHEEEEGKSKEEIKGESSSIQSPVSAPSSSSTSPSHEFSFTISLHSSSDYKTKTPSSVAADLSPADDIFFHGHLLPLHLLPDSHLPASPRLSTSSLDSFNVTGRESFNYPRPVKVKPISNIRKHERVRHSHNTIEAKVKNKSKSFSLFSLKRLQKGGVKVRETEEKENEKKKIGFDVSHVLKRYMRMIRPLLFFRRKRENNLHLHPHTQAYSFSGNLSWRNRKAESRGRRGGYYSAPSSMRTSPSHSGLLVATKGSPSSTSDSTMEELQAAIQSAIAHCKNSIKGEEKLKC
ncbi:BRI1 kinase inhibitor 1 [Hibiscus trionum]|uniref:BRI1 kinase inhibitor 1 n=1 Tax=Hibiscus trionum TaxID=183268 RepID=A0A9W7IWL1_HIBTR|nr:BRI1 kinase inhibitor 1 [Hibiscus trionum]